MFAALTGWYTGSERNRRRYPRVKRDFHVEYTVDGARWEVAQGVDLSGGGLCMFSRWAILPNVFDARIEIGEQMLAVQLRKIWGTATEYRGKEVPYYGLQFERIAPRDWEILMRSIIGRTPSRTERFEAIPIDEADVNRLLPSEFREQLIHDLKNRSRIDAQKPQMAFEYGGVIYDKERC